MTDTAQRAFLLTCINEATQAGARQQAICELINLEERTLQRWQAAESLVDKRTLRHHSPPHKLSETERQAIISITNQAAYEELPPSQIVPLLADKGIYIGSESSFYRVLREAQQVRHRRSSKPPQPRHSPQALCATAPNQVYCWDITYLPTTVQGQYVFLYMFLDVFSRYIVGWQVYAEESSQHASELMKDICWRENIQPNQVTLHSDNGSPMKGSTMLATLQALGVAKSFSRPAVSNDNPFAESVFNTLKHRPQLPLKKFTDVSEARQWAERLIRWYNHEHCHSGIRFVTPAQRHAGLDTAILIQRQAVYEQARAKNPMRWSGHTRNWQMIEEVHLNPSKDVLTIEKNIKVAA